MALMRSCVRFYETYCRVFKTVSTVSLCFALTPCLPGTWSTLGDIADCLESGWDALAGSILSRLRSQSKREQGAKANRFHGAPFGQAQCPRFFLFSADFGTCCIWGLLEQMKHFLLALFFFCWLICSSRTSLHGHLPFWEGRGAYAKLGFAVWKPCVFICSGGGARDESLSLTTLCASSKVFTPSWLSTLFSLHHCTCLSFSCVCFSLTEVWGVGALGLCRLGRQPSTWCSSCPTLTYLLFSMCTLPVKFTGFVKNAGEWHCGSWKVPDSAFSRCHSSCTRMGIWNDRICAFAYDLISISDVAS